MTMGEYIKFLRTGGNVYGKKWSQGELGQLLNPKVNRAAVNKWETGLVENIKRTHIEQMARLFGTTPIELLCFDFDSRFDVVKISEELKVIEQIQNHFGKSVVDLIQYFTELNDLGKQKALNAVADLTEIPKYTKGSR